MGDVGEPKNFRAPKAIERTLEDGRRIRIRPVDPRDKAKLSESLAAQSLATRYRRFMSDKQRLTDKELRYLTEVDGEHHFALVAVRIDKQGQEQEGVCSARFVELEDEPGVAEPALAVADAYQGCGIGRDMFARLIEAGLERGFTHFHCELLADNHRMLRILESNAHGSERHLEGSALVLRFALAGPDEST